MSEGERDKIPQELRVWLRYRSENTSAPIGPRREGAGGDSSVGEREAPPGNRFRAGYDFPELIAGCPQLAAFVAPNAYGHASIDYADPDAVKALNQALLKSAYGIEHWDVPPGYLCPPIPGRSDYLHYLADLLESERRTAPGRRRPIAVLDIGMGANCIYPLIGASEYGWHFVGSEIDRVALRWAKKVVAANPALVRPDRLPASGLAARVLQWGRAARRDIRPVDVQSAVPRVGRGGRRREPPQAPQSGWRRTGGGQAELRWHGRRALVRGRGTGVRAAHDRAERGAARLVPMVHHPCFEEHTPASSVPVPAARGAAEVRTIEMAQGQKTSRILAWTFARD